MFKLSTTRLDISFEVDGIRSNVVTRARVGKRSVTTYPLPRNLIGVIYASTSVIHINGSSMFANNSAHIGGEN